MNYLDFTTASLDLLTTYLYVIASMWMWPLTILTSTLNIVLFYQIGIYGDSGMATFYVLSAIYGWYNWNRGKREEGKLVITTLSTDSAVFTAISVIIMIILLGTFLKSVAHSTVPYWDATTTTLSITSQWLFCRKKLETWITWFIADLVYLVLYFYKGVPFNGTITLVYLYMAIIGYVRWSKLVEKKDSVLATA